METEGLLAALRQLLRSAAAPQQPGFGSMLQPAQQGHSSRNHDPQTHQAAGTSAVPAWDAPVCVPPEPEAGLQQLVCNVNPKSVMSSKDAFYPSQSAEGSAQVWKLQKSLHICFLFSL